MWVFNKSISKEFVSNKFVLKVEQIKPKHVTLEISLLLINNMSTKILCIEYITRRGGFWQRLLMQKKLNVLYPVFVMKPVSSQFFSVKSQTQNF